MYASVVVSVAPMAAPIKVLLTIVPPDYEWGAIGEL
jgi:hypothetical protein